MPLVASLLLPPATVFPHGLPTWSDTASWGIFSGDTTNQHLHVTHVRRLLATTYLWISRQKGIPFFLQKGTPSECVLFIIYIYIQNRDRHINISALSQRPALFSSGPRSELQLHPRCLSKVQSVELKPFAPKRRCKLGQAKTWDGSGGRLSSRR